MRKIRFVIFLLFAVHFTTSGEAQSIQVDSVRKLLASDLVDTNRVINLIEFGKLTSETSKEVGLRSFYEALSLSKELIYERGIGWSSLWLAWHHSAFGGLEDSAMYYDQRALSIGKKIGDAELIGEAYLRIGQHFAITESGQEKALEYYDSSIVVLEEIQSYSILSEAFQVKAAYYMEYEMYDEAELLLLDALDLYDYQEDAAWENEGYLILGSIALLYTKTNELDSALSFYYQALENITGTDNPRWESFLSARIANIYLLQGKYDSAVEIAKVGLTIAEDHGLVKEMQDNIFTLYSVYSEKGDYKTALEYFEWDRAIADSLSSLSAKESIVLYDNIMKAERDKEQIELLEKENEKNRLVRNGALVGFGIVSLFAIIFFTQRNKIKKGKKLSDELLLNILPEEVAEELKAKGYADARMLEQVTVLFTDFKGFTQLTETLSPTDLVLEINEYFTAFDTIMQKHNVEKIKTIGDAYMAAGGLPAVNNTNAQDVVLAALEIQQFMKDQKVKKSSLGKMFFDIRIGVHTGPVVAGIVGIKKFSYDIWGDTVNTASRMESSGEIGQVNISGTTYELVKDKFACTHRGKIQAKNKGELDMYFVTS